MQVLADSDLRLNKYALLAAAMDSGFITWAE
jgi:hypothetical protein